MANCLHWLHSCSSSRLRRRSHRHSRSRSRSLEATWTFSFSSRLLLFHNHSRSCSRSLQCSRRMISEEWSVHNKQNINTKPNPVDSEKKLS